MVKTKRRWTGMMGGGEGRLLLSITRFLEIRETGWWGLGDNWRQLAIGQWWGFECN